ncbi:MAG: YcaQ family DNA glycosylase [Thermaceae bacterium]|nr:YcaQ family DNA glycosylase [Thermaceae bacterium]
MRVLATTPEVLRRVILAQQGLLRWQGGSGEFIEGVPWREQLKGAEGTLETLRRLEAVQLDPVNVVAPNHHLVFSNRVGDYKPEHLEALYPQKQVFEYWAQARCILPVEDWPLFEWRREHWRLEHTIEGMMVNSRDEGYVPEILEAIEHIRSRLAQEGPLPARVLDTGKKVRGNWGFTAKATSQAMEHMWWAGEIAVSHRKGDERHFALAEDWLPESSGVEGHSQELSLQAKLLKFIRAYGVFDAYGTSSRLGWREWAAGEKAAELERLQLEGTLIPLQLEGIKRKYYLWAELLPLLESLQKAKIAPDIYFLPPLDNLLWRRERISDLFGFDYKWEIYVPDEKRKYGPYVLPILEGQTFIGRLDARMNRANKKLVVRRIFWEGKPNKLRLERIQKALGNFARGLGVEIEYLEP